jgi:hypothetical protein
MAWVTRVGELASELVRVAEEQQARAIAVGGHEHGALTAALVRSVDSSLVHLYCGTLFIVRTDVRTPVEPSLPGYRAPGGGGAFCYIRLPLRTWLSGRAQPCQGWGRGFESRRPLQENPRSHAIFDLPVRG